MHAFFHCRRTTMSCGDQVCAEADKAVERGVKIIIVSDAAACKERVPISSAMVSGALHHHLVRSQARTRVMLVVDSGEAREVHHMCVLLGYGADAIFPRAVFRALVALKEEKTGSNNYVKALHKGILKIMAKMGISTLQSYVVPTTPCSVVTPHRAVVMTLL